MKPRLLTYALLLSVTLAGCVDRLDASCDAQTCIELCLRAGYITGQCTDSECHCSYDNPGNSNWNPWAIPDAGDVCGGCPAGTLCCDGSCIDIEADDNNCGLCGRVCPEGEHCLAGWCMCGSVSGCIEGSEKCCADECVNILYDPTNCGNCGVGCVLETGPECVDGACVCPQPPIYGPSRACDGTYEDMCCERTLLAMGGCFDLGNDREHCGSCEHSCAVFEGQICLLGECTESLNP
ncbi:MAG: hypothetical protein ABI333_23710 [bacterium]